MESGEKIEKSRVITPGLVFNYMETPLGELELCANDLGLVSILFVETSTNRLSRQKTSVNKIISSTRNQLSEFFEGNRKHFEIPFIMKGTDFQNRVWNELLNIPFGKTISYLHLARKLGDEKCIRAAASANGKNPFSIVVPCHRVIGMDGSLTGYAGDLWRKQWLLEHEEKLSGTYSKLF